MTHSRHALVFCAFLPLCAAAAETVTFNEHIRPILAENCFACHGTDANKRKAKLRLDLAESAYADRDGSRAIVPRDLQNSELWHRINSTDPDELMPPEESHKPPLSPAQRALIKRWIESGAVYQKHWAFEPIRRPEEPAIPDGEMERQRDGREKPSPPLSVSPSPRPASNPVDAFIIARLARSGLKLSPEAPREAQLRRLTLDLTGLPPTVAELDAFLADRAPDAYERAVTRLLDSPRYGEHFARTWLDAVRYADTHGLHLDNVRNIWPYRDWVVAAFNRNLPFDQFTIEQLAGDLLPNPTVDQLVATGYNRNHLSTSEGGAIEEEAEARTTMDRVNTTATVWLGLTAGCAQCHDHKFDPISQREYYSLGAFFKGLADRCWDGNIPKPGPLVVIGDAKVQARLKEIDAAYPPLAAALSARAAALEAVKKLTDNTTVAASPAVKPSDEPRRSPTGEGGPPARKSAKKSAKKNAKLDLAVATAPKPPPPVDGDTDDLSGDAAKKPAAARPAGVSYEVVWAEDDDTPYAINYGKPPPAGEWRSGVGVPVIAGQRALRLEGAIERPVDFGGSEVLLIVRTAAKAFAYFNPDLAHPPRAVSLQFISEEKTRRVIWGDPAAFGPDAAKDAIVAGPLPPVGAYTRLEIDAVATGLAKDKPYSGLRVAQSGGAAWWDRIGAACTSPSANADPLLNSGAWVNGLRNFGRAETGLPLPHETIFLIGLSGTQQTKEEKARIVQFHRDFIMGPTRAALEPEANAARRLLVERTHYEMTLPSSPVSRELPEPRAAHILLRGQYDKPGDTVTPATPAFLPPLSSGWSRGALAADAPGSGAPAETNAAGAPRLQETPPRPSRLDLARWLVDPKNPLTARVAVNRFWQQLFGAGLVRTPHDFGVQGETPTHPELLDWLASEFVRTGWDVKQFVRLLVTSRTYRQESRVTPALLATDPENKLLARAPRLRLDAEVLRDQALALGGLLRPEIGGPPVRPYQPINIWEPVAFGGSNTKTYVQEHGDALYRRSLYTFWKRTAPAPSMVTFDAPSREIACAVRPRSNTPLQALALMNDVQHIEAARGFAAQLLARAGDDTARLTFAFRSATARTPTGDEQKLLAATLAKHRAHFAADPEAAKKVLTNGESPAPSGDPVALAAWTMLANLLLNLDETINRS
ncbi:MAG: PSD1 domain-containing protein [Verrucomicrobia bacterium]|nr:PSD1 domain-containing protein [Verrucomicrobiota bacterium]